MWKNIVEPGRPQMTIRRLRIACWIPRATNTHTPCVVLTAFPQQHWLHERASMLRYTYIDCLIRICMFQTVWHCTYSWTCCILQGQLGLWRHSVLCVCLPLKFRSSGCLLMGSGVVYWLRRCAASRKVPGPISGFVTGFFPWLPTEPCAFGSTQPLKMSTGDFSWGKGSRCVWLTTYHPYGAETSRKSVALTYPEPLGPPRPVAGHLYFT